MINQLLGRKMNAEKLKWIFYEKRSKFRDFYFHKAIRRHIFEKYLNKDPYIPFYADRWVMGKGKTNQWIADKIRSGEPFMEAFVRKFGRE